MIDTRRVITWHGPVNEENTSKNIEKILALLNADSEKEIFLLVYTGGGGMELSYGFYDFVKAAKVPLCTIGLGRVASAGTVLFLSGRRRIIAPRAVVLVHALTTSFKECVLSREELYSLRRKADIADDIYEKIIVSETGGKISKEALGPFMRAETYFTAQEAVEVGLAHGIWLPEDSSPA